MAVIAYHYLICIPILILGVISILEATHMIIFYHHRDGIICKYCI